MSDSSQLALSLLKRLLQARMAADAVLADEKLHRVAMATVFTFEDTYEALLIMVRQRKSDPSSFENPKHPILDGPERGDASTLRFRTIYGRARQRGFQR